MSFNLNGPNKVFLVVQRGPDIGARIELNQRQITMGRNPDNVIVLTDPLVSRYHAVIQYDLNSGQASVIDLGSTNGVMVNEKHIDPGLPYLLQQRDSVSVGRSVFNLQMRPENYRASLPPERLSDPEITQSFQPRPIISQG